MSLARNSVPPPARTIAAHSRRDYYPSRFTLTLFLLFAANTVFPLVDVPLLGLSITAVLFALVTLEIVFRSDYLSLRLHARWYLLAYAIGFAVFLSLTMNGLAANLDFGASSILSIVQATYWLLVFIITMELVSRLKPGDVRRLSIVLGISIIAVGLLRLSEAVAFDRVGPVRRGLLSQNTYGILFSTFTPFAFVLVFLLRSAPAKLLAWAGVLLLLVAIAINGSRSSWLASTLGLTVLTVLFLVTRPRKGLSLGGFVAVALLAGSLLVAVAPPAVIEPISARFATLDRVEEDKSYATRELMQQKALILFSENPFFGVGRGQFRQSEVQFDLTVAVEAYGRNPSKDFNRVASHNSYAQWIAELGLAGTIPLAILLVLLAVQGLRASIALARSGEIWSLAIYAGFIAMSVHLWSIDNLQTTSTWFMYGLVAAMIEYQRYPRPAIANV